MLTSLRCCTVFLDWPRWLGQNIGVSSLHRACASFGICHNQVTAQPSSRPTASPIAPDLCPPCLHTRRGLLCLQYPVVLEAGATEQWYGWWEPSWPQGVPVLPQAHSETVNHPEQLTGFVILNRAWTRLSRGESTMSYCNSFYQPMLSWT